MGGALKHRWSVSNNSLTGIPSDRWWQLLKENHFAVDPAYYHRFAFLTALSYLNSAYRRKEDRLYGTAVENTEVTEAPVFILGHYRNGTTHLHNLLAVDAEQFAYPNTYQSANAYTFLSSEKTHAKILAPLLDKTRPMDNMALGLHLPQEDEYALSLASFCSPFLAYSFPRHYERYVRYITFDDVPEKEIERWQAALLWFVKKLTLKYGRRLVLKSPPHTGRVRLIQQVFPDALFIHIHRDPYVAFQSTRYMYGIVPWLMCLHSAENVYTDERIIDQYATMYDSYFRDIATVPSDQRHEVQFEALEQDPIGEMRLIYEKFGFRGFDVVKPRLQRYVDSIADYKKNTYPEIPAPLREKLAARWQRCFKAWDYPRH